MNKDKNSGWLGSNKDVIPVYTVVAAGSVMGVQMQLYISYRAFSS